MTTEMELARERKDEGEVMDWQARQAADADAERAHYLDELGQCYDDASGALAFRQRGSSEYCTGRAVHLSQLGPSIYCTGRAIHLSQLGPSIYCAVRAIHFSQL